MNQTTEIKPKRGRPVVPNKEPVVPNKERKKSTSFYLSDDTRGDLKALAADMRLSQASVIEMLVQDAIKARGVKIEA